MFSVHPSADVRCSKCGGVIHAGHRAERGRDGTVYHLACAPTPGLPPLGAVYALGANDRD